MAEWANLPDIAFVQEDAAETLRNMIANYEARTGRTLQPADPVMLILSSLAAIIVQQSVLINQTAKAELLRYATGAALDHLGVFQQTDRLPASPALTVLQFKLSIPLSSATSIPSGTRGGPQGGDGAIFFETTEYLEIPPGQTEGIVSAKCSISGTVGNGFLPGQINILMDQLPFVQSVNNLSTSSGGADVETDDSYRERIHKAPSSFSTAGPADGYVHWTKAASASIADVAVYSPAPTEVTVVPLLYGGGIPEQALLDEVYATLNARSRRPLTDLVHVEPPDVVTYDIDLTYWIQADQTAQIDAVRAKVDDAVRAYVLWQKSKLGRDKNPSELIRRVMQAGAYRADAGDMAYATIPSTSVAIADEITITYGGLIHD